MSAERAFRAAAARKRWSPEQQVDVLLEYVDRQDSDGAFQDYLDEAQD